MPFHMSKMYIKKTQLGTDITNVNRTVGYRRGRGGGGEYCEACSMGYILGYKEHLDWLKIDLNAAKIITVQDYKHAKN